MGDYDEALDQQITKISRFEPRQALSLAQELVRIYPNERRAWASLAYVYEVMKDFQNALTALESAEKVAPDDPVSHFSIGRIHIDLMNYDDATRFFSRSIELSEIFTSDYYLGASRLLRSYCYCMVKKFSEAQRDLDRLDGSESWWIGKIVTKRTLENMCLEGRID